MTWTELYNRLVFEVWGNSTPPQGTQAVLQGEYGLIANAHRKIQEDYNYWFMETTWTTTLTSGISSYALPERFKEVVQNGFHLADATTGDFLTPLAPLLPGDAFNYFKGSTNTADYPQHYEIYGANLVVYPIPSLTGVVLSAKVFKYLPRPPAVFDATYDDLTRNGHDAIIYEAAANICRIQEEYQKEQRFMEQFVMAIERLMQMDARWRRSETNTCLYTGI